MSSAPNVFDATPSILGYLYQVRYALLVALKKMREVDDPDVVFITIEKFDDVAFEKNGSPFELLQTKYHGVPGNLTDRGPDLWKTLRVWANSFLQNDQIIGNSIFSLITTQKIQEGSIASYLVPDEKRRDEKNALEQLNLISKESTNKDNQPAYKTFESLPEFKKKALLASIYVFGEQAKILDLEQLIKNQLRGEHREHLDAFTTRLEGKWFQRVLLALTDESQKSIS